MTLEFDAMRAPAERGPDGPMAATAGTAPAADVAAGATAPSAVPPNDAAKQWFTVDQLDPDTYAISEYRHPEETHCYLLNGDTHSLLIDTGLGICDISQVVAALATRPVTAIATHVHWDHIGGHAHYPRFYAHAAELDWLRGHFPLPLAAVRRMVCEGCQLPPGFDPESYHIFQGTPTRLVQDGEVLDLGGRAVTVLHTPGHAPGHLCFFEAARGWLFTGDLVYHGTLYAHYPSTDPAAYLASLEKVAALPVRRVFPGHHTLAVAPALLPRMRDAFLQLRADGQLCHGSGTHTFDDWAVWF